MWKLEGIFLSAPRTKKGLFEKQSLRGWKGGLSGSRYLAFCLEWIVIILRKYSNLQKRHPSKFYKKIFYHMTVLFWNNRIVVCFIQWMYAKYCRIFVENLIWPSFYFPILMNLTWIPHRIRDWHFQTNILVELGSKMLLY